ncbi:MAG: tetratricopeptide repeat protein, partial [Flavobacteriales bacterium]|nr:tetratricopeptide repeat protein [Flavobacteriales bacterium]
STEINEDGLIHISYNSIGSIYADQKDFLKALEYYNKSLELADRINDKEGVGVSLNNIGAIYKELKDFSNALKYFSKSLKIFEELENSYGVSSLLDNMGVIYQYQGNMTKSMDCFVKSLKLCEELDDKSGVASSLNNIGTNYIAQKKYNKALDYCSKSMEMSMELGFPESIKVSANKLSIIYQQQGNYKKALEMRNLEILMKDSLNNEATQKATAQQQAKYEYEKQKAIDDATHDKQIALEQEEQKKQQIISVSIGMGLFLVVIFLAFVFNRLQVTRKQKIVIEQQRDLVEHAHKEIKDSINYAERIQRSFLATSDLLNENLKDYFVFFQPKDVVSGDFYWAGKLTNNQFAILNADSTGHGVPGAIMSILNISSIEKAVEKGITNPAQIFNDTRKTIIERLKKDGSLDGGKDGMDATMISFDFANNKLNYVAAQNPIWIIRNNNLIEIKPEKIPVGKHDNDNIPFIGGEFETKKGDVIYTLTDGFQDQFGGENGKKFKVKPFKTFLISISHLPMNKQKEKIEETFINWKGKEEQVDDVCIVGIKI